MKIGEKEYKTNVSVGTMLDFENQFGKSFAETAVEVMKLMQKAQKEKEEDRALAIYGVKAKTLVDVTKLAYSMITDDIGSYEEWVKTLPSISTKTYMEILTMAQSVFQG